MTVSSMPCCRKTPESLAILAGRFWRALGILLLGMWVLVAGAAEIESRSAQITATEDGYILNADFRIELGQVLEDVVAHGVPLYFNADFELTRPRWYWLSETLSEKSRVYRLSYHALTRQYRLSSGALFQNFNSLQEALAILSRVRSWNVADRGALKPGEAYQAALRLRLDWAQLPKPLQVSNLTSREWYLGSDWYRWNVTGEPR